MRTRIFERSRTRATEPVSFALNTEPVEVFEEDKTMTDMNIDPIFPRGEDNPAMTQYFTGQSYFHPLTTDGIDITNVTFEAGCRNNWHIHHASSGGGQILLVTAGSGWYQAEGEDPVSLEPGMVIQIAEGLKHWHGAKSDSWFTHIAIAVPGEDARHEWLEPVTDAEYAKLS